MADVMQGSGPLDHGYLTADALKPASSDDIMRALNRVSDDDVARAANNSPKRRGRPPGSRNLTPEERVARGRPPVPGQPKRELTTQEEAAAKAAAIKADAEKIANFMTGELNDHLMTMLIGLGVPSKVLYKPGMEPQLTQANTKFTPIGNAFAIPPNLAKNAGRLAAELKTYDTVSKISGTVTEGKGPLVVALVMTVFGTVQYAKSVSNTMELLRPVMEQLKANAQAEAAKSDGNVVNLFPNSGGPA